METNGHLYISEKELTKSDKRMILEKGEWVENWVKAEFDINIVSHFGLKLLEKFKGLKLYLVEVTTSDENEENFIVPVFTNIESNAISFCAQQYRCKKLRIIPIKSCWANTMHRTEYNYEEEPEGGEEND